MMRYVMALPQILVTTVYDKDNQVGSLVLTVDATEITNYTYDSGFVTITAIGAAFVADFEAFERIFKEVNKFNEQIITRYRPLDFPTGPHAVEREKLVNSLTAKIEVNGEELTNLLYNHLTGTITVQPRPADVLTWPDFLRWWVEIGQIGDEIRVF